MNKPPVVGKEIVTALRQGDALIGKIHFHVYNTDNSISPETGALIVHGGAGIAKDVNIGGSLTIGDILVVNNIIMPSSTSTLDSSGLIYVANVDDTNPNSVINIDYFNTHGGSSKFYESSHLVLTGSDETIIYDPTLDVTGNITNTGNLTVTGTIDSSDHITGNSMSCLTAPTNANDVIRLSDISFNSTDTILITSITYYENKTAGTPMATKTLTGENRIQVRFNKIANIMYITLEDFNLNFSSPPTPYASYMLCNLDESASNYTHILEKYKPTMTNLSPIYSLSNSSFISNVLINFELHDSNDFIRVYCSTSADSGVFSANGQLTFFYY